MARTGGWFSLRGRTALAASGTPVRPLSGTGLPWDAAAAADHAGKARKAVAAR